MIRTGVLHRFEDWRKEISNAVLLSRINWERAMAYSQSVQTFQEEYLAFLKNTAHISTTNTCGISGARSYRTLRDGSFEGRFSRHFVPGYDQPVPPGQNHSPSKGLALSWRLWAEAWA